MGGTRSPQLLKISKSIWNYLLSHQITITAEYLSSRLNVRADWESRNATYSSDWKLHQKVYLKITKLLGTPTVDLFASRLCPQLPQYMTWKPDPNSFATDAMQQDRNKMFGFAFPPFSLIGRVNKQGSSRKCKSNDTSDTHMTFTTLVYSSTKNVHTTSIAFTNPPKPITKSPGRKTSSCKNQVPKVSSAENYRKTLEMEGISSSAAKLISMPRIPGTNCRLRIDLEQVG